MRSIQQQLRRQWLISLLVLMLPLLLLADYGVRQIVGHYVLSRLQHDADSLIAALQRDPQSGRWQLQEQRLGTVYQRVYSGHYYAVRNTDALLQSRSLWDKTPPVLNLSSGERRDWTQPGINTGNRQEMWLNLALGITVDNQPFTLWLAEDISAQQQQLQRYRLGALALLGLTLLILLLIQRGQLSRAFARLHPLQQQLRELRFGERDNLGAASGQYPQEVQPLAEEIDRLLQQLQQRVGRSRNALGNLAHEMKRPLQQLQLLAEQLSPQQQQQQREVLERLQTLIQRELKRARIVGVASPGRHTKLADELPALLDVLQRLYPQVTIASDFPADAILPQDRDDMLELLGNLLDNACLYGGNRVQLSIRNQAGAWQIQVCDNGPGISAGQRAQLLQRGVRLDESGPQGSGLGLAIVQDIVSSYGGTLALSANAPQGLCVDVQLPASSHG
ncbi:sensor histidine kinase [Venatoribacter cucullus]|uniref:sensor histidine kinase n=1 Tax=Venatoribacter cucullus TaxID=2661630 RepID=UPI002240D565|nr:ATP-binding protein [Venatoribacter cucullus]UZK04766.1 sensor histidine kinase [Venatoribacter cucullus]